MACLLIFLILTGAGIINIATEYSAGFNRQGKFVESFGRSAIGHGIMLISFGTMFLSVGWRGRFGLITGLFSLVGLLLSFVVLYLAKHHG